MEKSMQDEPNTPEDFIVDRRVEPVRLGNLPAVAAGRIVYQPEAKSKGALNLDVANMISTLKNTNPKDAVGSDKLPLHLWPESATAYGCIGLLNGMLKYGRTNWRQAGIRPSIYIDAAKRHLTDWFEGNDYDPEDGVHNLSAALACMAILVDSIETGNMNDDRNYNGKSWRSARANMEPHVKRLKEMHALRQPKHYSIKDSESGKS